MGVADASAAAGPTASSVGHLKVGHPDYQGAIVQAIYQRKTPAYAVYSTGDRVLIHYHDVKAEADRQRRDLSPLLPLRDEIEGLLRGWRSDATGFFGLRNTGRLKSRAMCEDGRVGAALALALEDDVPGAQLQLEKIKNDILNERVAGARFEYLLTASLTALVAMFLAWLLASLLPSSPLASDSLHRGLQVGGVMLALVAVVGVGVGLTAAGRLPAWGRAALAVAAVAIMIGSILVWPATSWDEVQPGFAKGVDLWRAFAAGAVGAFFSIAIAIRGRTVLAELLRTANMMDAVLRVTIGAVGAAVVVAMIHNGAVMVNVANPAKPLFVIIIGFFAGFSERFVPDLLAKAVEKPADFDAKVAAAKAERDRLAGVRAVSGAAGSVAVVDTAGTATPPEGSDPAAANDNPVDDDEEVGPDGFQLEDDEVTGDEELPGSAGGVALPA